MDRTIGAYEAKTRLPELLREVAQGGRITITVRGRAVAELTPARPIQPSASEAVEAMKSFGLVQNVGAEDIEAWIAEGRN